MGQRALQIFRLGSLSDLELHNVAATAVTYRGRRAVRLVETDPAADGHAVAVLPRSGFGDGVIDTMIAGDRRAGAPEAMRGFPAIHGSG